jgi:WhiB family redox-sensing transcriptional regulator
MTLAGMLGAPYDVVQAAPLPCQRADPRLFFAESPKDLAIAKAMCADCPIRPACMAGALERQEPWGVWGGEVFVEGVVVARKRGRGRPRTRPEASTGPETAVETGYRVGSRRESPAAA